MDAEWKIIYDKLQRCADSGAKVVLSRLAIGDLGTQFFADRDIFCAGRVRGLSPWRLVWYFLSKNQSSHAIKQVIDILSRKSISSSQHLLMLMTPSTVCLS